MVQISLGLGNNQPSPSPSCSRDNSDLNDAQKYVQNIKITDRVTTDQPGFGLFVGNPIDDDLVQKYYNADVLLDLSHEIEVDLYPNGLPQGTDLTDILARHTSCIQSFMDGTCQTGASNCSCSNQNNL